MQDHGVRILGDVGQQQGTNRSRGRVAGKPQAVGHVQHQAHHLGIGENRIRHRAQLRQPLKVDFDRRFSNTINGLGQRSRGGGGIGLLGQFDQVLEKESRVGGIDPGDLARSHRILLEPFARAKLHFKRHGRPGRRLEQRLHQLERLRVVFRELYIDPGHRQPRLDLPLCQAFRHGGTQHRLQRVRRVAVLLVLLHPLHALFLACGQTQNPWIVSRVSDAPCPPVALHGPLVIFHSRGERNAHQTLGLRIRVLEKLRHKFR